MRELGGLLWLTGGLACLLLGSALVASCLRLRAPLEHALATYVLAWTWLVAVTYALSPVKLVTRGWLTFGIALGLAGAVAVWLRLDRPALPTFRPAFEQARLALRSPILLVLAVAVTAGAAYSAAIAIATPVNDGDALVYHVGRAAFWHQEHGLGYVANTVDRRLDINPPNAEIGQLATMVLSGHDRYVALPQLFAYGALVLAVAALARRIRLGAPETLFGTLAFATLPIVVLQSSGALNDLVVASFLSAAAVFALRPSRASLLLFALAIGLALGTKFTAVLALPTLALVAAVGRRPREWPGLLGAGLVGAALGSAWYLLNLFETGQPDGGLAEEADQRAGPSPAAIATTAMRLTLDLVDLSGAPDPYSLLYVITAVALCLLGVARFRRSASEGLGLLAAAAIAASVSFFPDIADFGQRGVYKAWLQLGRPDATPFADSWGINWEADATTSWFGPLGVLLISLGAVYALVRWARGNASPLTLALALAPWVLLLTLAATIVWDPWRGRFLVFGVALAAATWGHLLRSRIVAVTTATVGVVTLFLSLANMQAKPSGLAAIWPRGYDHQLPVRSVWSDESRWETQVRLRAGAGDDVPLRFVEQQIPADAKLAFAPRENDFHSPYFGPRLTRRVSIVRGGDVVPPEAEWLIVSPGALALRCPGAWQVEIDHPWGWRIERRVGPDSCLS